MTYKCTKLSKNIIVLVFKDSNKEPIFIKYSMDEEYNICLEYEKVMYDYLQSKNITSIPTILDYQTSQIQYIDILVKKHYVRNNCICINVYDDTIILPHELIGDINGERCAIMIGVYSNKYVDLHSLFEKYCSLQLVSQWCSLLSDIVEKDLRANDFVHGDLKTNNILTHVKTGDMKIIDPEAATIVKTNAMISKDCNEAILGYLLVPGVYTKEFLFIFDLIVFSLTLHMRVNMGLLDLVRLLINKIKSEEYNTAFLDLTTILFTMCIHHTSNFNYKIGDVTICGHRESYIANASFPFCEALFSTSEDAIMELTKDYPQIGKRHVEIQNIIKTCKDSMNVTINNEPFNSLVVDESNKQKSLAENKLNIKTEYSSSTTLDSLEYSPDM